MFMHIRFDNFMRGPKVNQFEYHVGMGPDPEGLVSYCKSVGVVPQAYSPLGPTYNTTAKNELIEGNLTVSIGKHYNKSGAQVGHCLSCACALTLTCSSAAHARRTPCAA